MKGLHHSNWSGLSCVVWLLVLGSRWWSVSGMGSHWVVFYDFQNRASDVAH